MIGIDPTVDFVCKRLLGSPDRPALTIHFLNSFLRFASPIREVRILNPTIEKEFEEDKWSLLDILATDEVGRVFNIEIQTSRPIGLVKRLTYYVASLLVDQLEIGDKYQDLRPSIGVCLLDAIELVGEPSLHNRFELRNETGRSLTDCLQIHLIELPKYIPPDDNEPIDDPVDQWLFFFRHAEKSTGEELTRRLPHPVFKSATGVLQMIAKNPDERRLYNSRLKMERDVQARVDQACAEAAEKAMQQGIEKGIEQGIEQGMQQGIEQGIEQGMQKGIEKGLETGIERGLERGEIMGEIKALRRVLGEQPISLVDLGRMTNAQLITLRDELLRRCDTQTE